MRSSSYSIQNMDKVKANGLLHTVGAGGFVTFAIVAALKPPDNRFMHIELRSQGELVSDWYTDALFLLVAALLVEALRHLTTVLNWDALERLPYIRIIADVGSTPLLYALLLHSAGIEDFYLFIILPLATSVHRVLFGSYQLSADRNSRFFTESSAKYAGFGLHLLLVFLPWFVVVCEISKGYSNWHSHRIACVLIFACYEVWDSMLWPIATAFSNLTGSLTDSTVRTVVRMAVVASFCMFLYSNGLVGSDTKP